MICFGILWQYFVTLRTFRASIVMRLGLLILLGFVSTNIKWFISVYLVAELKIKFCLVTVRTDAVKVWWLRFYDVRKPNCNKISQRLNNVKEDFKSQIWMNEWIVPPIPWQRHWMTQEMNEISQCSDKPHTWFSFCRTKFASYSFYQNNQSYGKRTRLFRVCSYYSQIYRTWIFFAQIIRINIQLKRQNSILKKIGHVKESFISSSKCGIVYGNMSCVCVKRRNRDKTKYSMQLFGTETSSDVFHIYFTFFFFFFVVVVILLAGFSVIHKMILLRLTKIHFSKRTRI